MEDTNKVEESKKDKPAKAMKMLKIKPEFSMSVDFGLHLDKGKPVEIPESLAEAFKKRGLKFEVLK